MLRRKILVVLVFVTMLLISPKKSLATVNQYGSCGCSSDNMVIDGLTKCTSGTVANCHSCKSLGCDCACAPENSGLSGYSSTSDALEKYTVSTTTLNDTNTYNPLCTTTEGYQGTNTALGCIPVEMDKFIPWLLGWLFGVAGGIAFLLMSYGFILVATSAGDEKKVQGAKETITSAVVGLLVCVFAIFILRLIAVNILHIPGIN